MYFTPKSTIFRRIKYKL